MLSNSRSSDIVQDAGSRNLGSPTHLGEAVAELALVADDGGDEGAVLCGVLAAGAQAVEAPRRLKVVAPVVGAV